MIAIPPPPQKKVRWEPEKYCFCLILQIFFSNSQTNEIKWVEIMIGAGKGGRVGARPGGGGGHGRMNETIPCGRGFPYGGIFLSGQSFLST